MNLSLNVSLESHTDLTGVEDVRHSSRAFVEEVLRDYEICLTSREVSILARREALTGKAKFGITGDGKEVHR